MNTDADIFASQGLGQPLELTGPFGLVVIDCTNAFVDPGFLGGGNIAGAVRSMTGVLEAARRAEWPIAHTRMLFQADGSDANVFSRKIPTNLNMVPGSYETEFVDELVPREGELVIDKTLPSAFFGTGLAPWLTLRSVQTLVIIGATTSGCVRASVVDAMSHGFVPAVPADCVGDRSVAAHEASLFDMRMKYAEICDAATIAALAR